MYEFEPTHDGQGADAPNDTTGAGDPLAGGGANADAVSPDPDRRSNRWRKGQSGNPNGRPKGSKNKVSAQFHADLFAVWQTHGRDGLDALARERPADYVRFAAKFISRMPRSGCDAPEADLTEDEIDALIAASTAQST